MVTTLDGLATTGLVPISYREALSTLLHVSLFLISYNRPSTYHYRGALLSTLLHVSLIPTSHNRPGTYHYRGALLSNLLHVSLIPTSHNRPGTYQLQRNATEQPSTCYCLSVTQFAECTSTDFEEHGVTKKLYVHNLCS
jgi:hypothetical protein